MTTLAVERCDSEVSAGVATKAGEVPRCWFALKGCGATVEEHPAAGVVESLALVGQFHLTLIEHGSKHFFTRGEVGGQTVVLLGGVAHAGTNLLQRLQGLVEVVGTGGSLGEVEEHLSVAHPDEGRSALLETLWRRGADAEAVERRGAEGTIVTALADVDGAVLLCHKVGSVAVRRAAHAVGLILRGIPSVAPKGEVGA